MKLHVLLLLCLALNACSRSDGTASNAATARASDTRVTQLKKDRTALVKFSQPMVVREGDWLESQPEDGETFEQYVESKPTLPTTERKTIYIQPIGDFSAEQMRVIQLTADYMRAFFDLPVVMKPKQALGKVPKDLQRIQYPNNRQIQATYFVDQLLPTLLPSDAAALICLTSFDLYPGDTWNYIFGQASLEKRVGVWSLWRLEKENGKRAPKDLFLDRTLKVAMHETGHMFSMRHCTKYECLMSGTNHLGETDRRPLDTCPECTMKIAWAMKYTPEDRFKAIAEFWRKQGRVAEEKRSREKMEAVKDAP
jgi:archaemetzincin